MKLCSQVVGQEAVGMGNWLSGNGQWGRRHLPGGTEEVSREAVGAVSSGWVVVCSQAVGQGVVGSGAGDAVGRGALGRCGRSTTSTGKNNPGGLGPLALLCGCP